MMNTSHSAFVKTHRLHNAKSGYNANYGLWASTMCQCMAISCNKCAIH